jgi:hypothetical protein
MRTSKGGENEEGHDQLGDAKNVMVPGEQYSEPAKSQIRPINQLLTKTWWPAKDLGNTTLRPHWCSKFEAAPTPDIAWSAKQTVSLSHFALQGPNILRWTLARLQAVRRLSEVHL